jgi:hypothetical protein
MIPYMDLNEQVNADFTRARREGCEETVTLLEKLVEHTRFLGCEPRPMSVCPARHSTA